MGERLDRTEIVIDNDLFPRLLGVRDGNLRYIEERYTSSMTARDGRISVVGPQDEAESIRRVFIDLEALCREQSEISIDDVDTILRLAGGNGSRSRERETESTPGITVLEARRGPVQVRGKNQERYARMMESMAVVFAVGPAGTGKTYLAVAAAVDRLQRRLVDRIILTRPVIEAGETLGFLPGDLLEKVDPYFRPLYDALEDMMTRDRMRRFIDRGYIEIAPLAYMRGRTLNNAFVILDEAQNTTSGQMKMFLTRLGVSSNAVLTGDVTQIDLPDPKSSGLVEAYDLLQGIHGIGYVDFNDGDVVRHKLVAEILRAYQKNGERNGE